MYCLGLGGWASGSNKVISCVTQSEGRKTGSLNTSENSRPIKQKSMGH